MRKGIPYPIMPETSQVQKKALNRPEKNSRNAFSRKQNRLWMIYRYIYHEPPKPWKIKDLATQKIRWFIILIKALKHVGFLGPMGSRICNPPFVKTKRLLLHQSGDLSKGRCQLLSQVCQLRPGSRWEEIRNTLAPGNEKKGPVLLFRDFF